MYSIVCPKARQTFVYAQNKVGFSTMLRKNKAGFSIMLRKNETGSSKMLRKRFKKIQFLVGGSKIGPQMVSLGKTILFLGLYRGICHQVPKCFTQTWQH